MWDEDEKGGRQTVPDLSFAASSIHSLLPPLQGGSLCERFPGVKPKAESYNPFGISSASLDVNRRTRMQFSRFATTPSLHSPEFEDKHDGEDKNEAPGERSVQPFS
jgi:hypothetical protein